MNKTTPLYALALAAFVYFCVTGCAYLGSLGLNFDEAYVGVGARLIMLNAATTPWSKLILPCMHGGDFFFFGFTKEYLQIPFFMFWGQSVFVLRISQLVLAGAALFCSAFVLKRWFSARVGLLTFILFATNSSFIRAARLGHRREEIIQIFFVWTGLMFFELYRKSRNRFWLAAAFFTCGVALWAKMMFLGYICGAVGAMMLQPKKSAALLDDVFGGFKTTALAAAAFCLGAFPLIYHNATNKLVTFRRLFESLFNQNTVDWDNTSFITNLTTRLNDYYLMLTSNLPTDLVSAGQNPLNALLFAVSLTGVLWWCVTDRFEFSRRVFLFIASGYAVLFVLTSFVPVGHSSEHVLITEPFSQIVTALFISGLISRANGRKLIPLACAGALAVNFCVETHIMTQAIKGAKDGLAEGYYTPVVYKVDGLLKDKGAHKIVTLTPMLHMPLMFVAGTSYRVICDMKTYFGTRSVDDFYEKHISGLESFYLVHSPENPYGENDVFKALLPLLEQNGYSLNPIKTYNSPKNTTVFNLYRVSKAQNSDEQ